MAKIQLKSDKVTPFGGIFSVMEAFSNILEPAINRSLGLRCKFCGYQYGEILRALAAPISAEGLVWRMSQDI